MTSSVISTFGQCNGFVKNMDRQIFKHIWKHGRELKLQKNVSWWSQLLSNTWDAKPELIGQYLKADEYLGQKYSKLNDRELNDGILIVNQTCRIY